MLVKFFRNPKHAGERNGLSAIDYLLNERVEQGTSRILAGDENITRGIIRGIESSCRATCCCLSFEEPNIEEAQKMEIVNDFFNTMLPELEGRYNALVVEHTDKGRLELNIVIPNIDIVSNTPFTPYFHKRDVYRCHEWTKKTNLTYGFSDPNDPAKACTISKQKGETQLESADYDALDRSLHELAATKAIQSRAQIIDLLEEHGIEVKRRGADYISVKLPNSKKPKRFKGGIYDEQFGNHREYETICKEAAERITSYRNRDINRELEKISRSLDEGIKYAAAKNRERCEKDDARATRRKQANAKALSSQHRDSDRLAYPDGNDHEISTARDRSNVYLGSDNTVYNLDGNNTRSVEIHSVDIREAVLNDTDGNTAIQRAMQLITESEQRTTEAQRAMRERCLAIKDAFEIERGLQNARSSIRDAKGTIQDIASTIRTTAKTILKRISDVLTHFQSPERTNEVKDISEPTPKKENVSRSNFRDWGIER